MAFYFMHYKMSKIDTINMKVCMFYFSKKSIDLEISNIFLASFISIEVYVDKRKLVYD